MRWLTVRDNVEYGLRLERRSRSVNGARRSEKYLKAVGLLDFADHYPKQLSGGMKQRVAHRTHAHQRPPCSSSWTNPLAPSTRRRDGACRGMLLEVSRERGQHHPVCDARHLGSGLPRGFGLVLSSRPARYPSSGRRALFRTARHLTPVQQRIPDGRKAPARSPVSLRPA